MESNLSMFLISLIGVVAFALGYALGRRHKVEANNG